MKNTIVYLALMAAPLLVSGSQVHDSYAMGSTNGAVQQQDDRTDEGHREQDQRSKKPGDVLSPKEKDPQEREKASPEKKPRLKYRDESKCPC
jgi:hypothetical protein